MTSSSGVSVVIPTHNRSAVVERAIDSALGQTLEPDQIIVVDDGSSDDTKARVESRLSMQPSLRLLPLGVNAGGAAARNAGIRASTSRLVAFLDSDDEWLAGHLERSVRLLDESGAGMVFGSFWLSRAGRRIEQRCRPLRGDPLEYLFLGGGGFRTSTFVCDRTKLMQVMFDDSLQKHQDWDLLINFSRRHAVATDEVASVVLHADRADRLSARPNHEASARFFRKNRRLCSATGWLLFATIMLEATYRSEGPGPNFERYLQLVDELDAAAGPPIRRLTRLLELPGVGRKLFRAACGWYSMATAHRRPDPADPRTTG